MALFLYLRSYEWLKLPDRIGRHYQSKGGQRLWIVPNPEDSGGSSDYVFMVRSAGVGSLFPEWFGPIGWSAEAGYASLPCLRDKPRAAAPGYPSSRKRDQTATPQSGLVALPLRGVLSGLYYAGPDSVALRKTISSAQALREQIRNLKFEAVGM